MLLGAADERILQYERTVRIQGPGTMLDMATYNNDQLRVFDCHTDLNWQVAHRMQDQKVYQVCGSSTNTQ